MIDYVITTERIISDIKDIDNEPAEEMVIVKAIKNAGPDKKA